MSLCVYKPRPVDSRKCTTHTGVQALRVYVFTSLVQLTLESVRHTGVQALQVYVFTSLVQWTLESV